jgi:hypothetical protein
MNQLTIFKVISFLLVPVALLFGLMSIIVLIMALSANPALLIMAFAMACFVIYVFTSLYFLMFSISNQRPCKSSLKDWIKVNAYGSLFISVMFLMNALAVFFMNDINLRQIISEMMEQQPEIAGKITLDVFIKMFKVIAGLMFAISALTITHILIHFKLLKRYDYLFSK